MRTGLPTIFPRASGLRLRLQRAKFVARVLDEVGARLFQSLLVILQHDIRRSRAVGSRKKPIDFIDVSGFREFDRDPLQLLALGEAGCLELAKACFCRHEPDVRRAASGVCCKDFSMAHIEPAGVVDIDKNQLDRAAERGGGLGWTGSDPLRDKLPRGGFGQRHCTAAICGHSWIQVEGSLLGRFLSCDGDFNRRRMIELEGNSRQSQAEVASDETACEKCDRQTGCHAAKQGPALSEECR